MLRLQGIMSFVSSETLKSVADYSYKNPEMFKTEIVSGKDHTGETGELMYLFTPDAEITLSRYNHFHYLNDFEIGLSIDSQYKIADLERILKKNNFQFESGFFEGDEDNSYYLIPRRNGIFTPFHVISEKDTSRNRFLSSVKTIVIQVNQKAFSLSEEFIRLMEIEKTIAVEIISGEKNRIIKVESEIEKQHEQECKLSFDNVRLSFREKNWIFEQNEESI